MKRGPVLVATLLATLAAAAWLASRDDEGAVEIAASGRTGRDAPRPPPRRIDATAPAWPRPAAVRASDPWPFDAALARAWVPAPPPAPAVTRAAPLAQTAPAVPQAPPFPYTLIGRIEDGSQVHALLGSPLRTLGVKVQDVIDGQWRVEAISASSLTLTWLPGGQRQDLPFRPS